MYYILKTATGYWVRLLGAIGEPELVSCIELATIFASITIEEVGDITDTPDNVRREYEELLNEELYIEEIKNPI